VRGEVRLMRVETTRWFRTGNEYEPDRVVDASPYSNLSKIPSCMSSIGIIIRDGGAVSSLIGKFFILPGDSVF